MKESRYTGLHIVWVHSYEISWKGRLIETKAIYQWLLGTEG